MKVLIQVLAAILAAMVLFFMLQVMVERGQQLRAEEEARPFAKDGSHKALASYVRQRMHNPDSFAHVRTVKGGNEISMVYRGTNKFGGIVTNEVRAELGEEGELVQVWEVDD